MNKKTIQYVAISDLFLLLIAVVFLKLHITIIIVMLMLQSLAMIYSKSKVGINQLISSSIIVGATIFVSTLIAIFITHTADFRAFSIISAFIVSMFISINRNGKK
jgi:hypothetical protein